MTQTKRLCLWSGPQHPAYPLTLAFAQRNDTEVIDKPFYAHFLRRTGLDHPSREDILDSLDSRPQLIIENLLQLQDKEILFMHNMPHHMIGVNLDFLNSFSHIFLIRHPRLVIPFFGNQMSMLPRLEAAYRMQKELFNFLHKKGSRPLVIDTSSLIRYPRKIMQLICTHGGVAFQESMMKWYRHSERSINATGFYNGFNTNQEKEFLAVKYLELENRCYEFYVDMLVHASLPLGIESSMVA